MHPDHAHVPVLPGPPPSFITSTKEEKKRKYQVQFMSPIAHWNLDKLLVATTLKKTKPSSTPAPTITRNRQPFRISITLFNNCCLDCFFWGGRGGGKLSQKPSGALIVNCESAVITTTAKGATLPLTVSSDTGQELACGFWWEYRPRTSTRP